MQPVINSHASGIFVRGECWYHEQEICFAILREAVIFKDRPYPLYRHPTIHPVRDSPWFLKDLCFFFPPISCILNSLLCSSYCDQAIRNAPWSVPPALLSYFLAGWAPRPAAEPSTTISFIGVPSASLSNELRKILNILSWFHFNRLFFLPWDGQEAVAPELPFRCQGWAADFKSKVEVLPPPLPFLPFPLTFWSSEGSVLGQKK